MAIGKGSWANVASTLSGTPPTARTSRSELPTNVSIDERNDPAAALPASSIASTTATPRATAKMISDVRSGSRKNVRRISRWNMRRRDISGAVDLFNPAVAHLDHRVTKACGLAAVRRHDHRDTPLVSDVSQ